MCDIDTGSFGPDRYRLLTPRVLLLSLVFRLHLEAVVEKAAVRVEGKGNEVEKEETGRCKRRPADGHRVIELAIFVDVYKQDRALRDAMASKCFRL